MTTTSSTEHTSTVRANGIEIHYVEAGSGPPLVLLHGGLVTTSSVWAKAPIAYQPHLATLAREFRVIAPDQRGSGRTVHDQGEISMDRVADDVAALIEELDLGRPGVCGFSEGAWTATILAMRHPSSVGAVVNDAGFDLLDPASPTLPMSRTMLGGSPDATRADPDAAAANFAGAHPRMRAMFELMQADQDSGQGPGHWRTYLETTFDRWTTWAGYTFDDLARIEVPTLVMMGDRDEFCTLEDAGRTYRSLTQGELAVLPDTTHEITAEKVAILSAFLRRHG